MKPKRAIIPPKVSVATCLEPEDLSDLDRFCQAVNRSRGSVIRTLIHSLLYHAPRTDSVDTLAAWRERWKVIAEKDRG